MAIVNEPVRVEYQPAGGTAGLTVGFEILDETGNKDIVNFPDALLTEKPLTVGVLYQGEFIPDETGTWTVHIADSAGGTAIKQYVVVHDIEKLLAVPAMVA
jgi:hypothetical protein